MKIYINRFGFFIVTIIGLSFFYSTNLLSQKNYTAIQDIYSGGIIGLGFNPGPGAGGKTFAVNIPTGSSIRKIYLFAFSWGKSNNFTFQLNSNTILLSKMTEYNEFIGGVNSNDNYSSIHFLDITNKFSLPIDSFFFNIPPQNSVKALYTSFYLIFEYEKLNFQRINSLIVINNDIFPSNFIWKIDSINPINNSRDVGFAFLSSAFCDTVNDPSICKINNYTSSFLGGNDLSSSNFICTGVRGHFYYQNDSLFGLDDDTPDSLMSGTDALANIKSYLLNNNTLLNISFNTKNQFSPYVNSSPVIASFLTYTSPCDTFSSTLSKDTSICLGQTAQLLATGGTKYEWLPQQNLSCYNCPNPIFTGTQTTTYTCRIYNNDSCSKVLPVRIIVQNPKADSLKITKALCPNNNGTAQIFADTLLWGKLNYTINGTSNNTGSFTNLTPGWHNYTITDTLGCAVTDSLFIPAQVNVTAAFTSNPKTGFAPLMVNFTNLSNSSTINYWLITNQNKDTLLSTNNFQPSTFNFEQSGTYTTTLIACNNPPYCCDTISFTILVEDSAAILLPNVFSPNQDGVNDDYQLQLQAAWHFETLQAQIYNRWGEVIQQKHFNKEALTNASTSLSMTKNASTITLWDGFTLSGTPATAGTYFIVVNATLKDGKKISSRIAVSLVR